MRKQIKLLKYHSHTAAHTVTFMARKPGHLLMPGRMLCGALEVADIGMPWRIVAAAAGKAIVENQPGLWQTDLTPAATGGHKYHRGHLAVFSGPALATGAARLAALAGLKAGAGLVTLAGSGAAMAAAASQATAVMLHALDAGGAGVPDEPQPDEPQDDAQRGGAGLAAFIADPRLSAFVLGPAFGVGARARATTLAIAAGGKPLVLDADGISSFRDAPEALFAAFAAGPTRLVLTPHDGEFARLFPDLAAAAEIGKVERARRAAARARAVIVLKGADSVIAAPDGRVAINANAPPDLATAGSGDVLAGIIGALLGRGIAPFLAAAAGVHLHGAAGNRALAAHGGPGITAEDIGAAVRPFG